MGMDIPIENTPAIQSLNSRSLRNPFKKKVNDDSSSSSDSDSDDGQEKQNPDFLTKLSATVDKIKAYKAYFYDRRTREPKVPSTVTLDNKS